MKLVLKDTQTNGTAKPNQWSLEHGTRMIGRSSDSDWQVNDDARRVSKQHCTISRDQAGFFIVDRSANGTQVDGRLLLEGETTRLQSGSRIGIGTRTFEIVITGEAEADFSDPDQSLRISDETMTISAILSDIAPNGRASRGPIAAGTSNDAWPDAAPSPSGKKTKTISRNVEVGWDAPPSTRGVGSVLPNDWNEEPVESSKHEHTDAMNIPVLVSRPAKKQPVEEFDAVFTSTVEDPQDVPEAKSAARPDPVDDLLVRLEKETAECLAVLDIDHADVSSAPQGTSQRERLEGLIHQQRLLASSIETLIRTCTLKLEPRLIEAKTDAQNDWRSQLASKQWRQMMSRTDYWSAFKRQFDEDGRSLSVREFLQRAARGDAAREEELNPRQTDTMGVSNRDEA